MLRGDPRSTENDVQSEDLLRPLEDFSTTMRSGRSGDAVTFKNRLPQAPIECLDQFQEEVPPVLGVRSQTLPKVPVNFLTETIFEPHNMATGFGKNENDKLWNWSGSCQTKMALYALAYNAFNLLRFPGAVYESGGSALLITYFVIMILVMQPLVYFELLLGQFYLRRNSYKGITEARLFSFVAPGLQVGTLLTGLFFLPNQLISMNYASLYGSEAVNGQDPSSCACKNLIYNELVQQPNGSWTDSCVSLRDFFDSTGIPLVVLKDFNASSRNQQGYLSCELYYRSNIVSDPTFPESFLMALNLQLLIPVAIGTVIVLLVTTKRNPKLAVKVIIWISPLVIFAASLFLAYQLSWPGAKHGICEILGYDLNLLFGKGLKVWTEGAKLAFITSGVGFGILSATASSNPHRFPKLYQTSWVYICLVCSACLLPTLISFAEIGIVSEILKQADLRMIFQETSNLPLITFCSMICKNTYVFRWLSFGFFVLLFLSSCWPKIALAEGIISTYGLIQVKRNSWKRILLWVTAPLIMILVEAIYVLPEARYILEGITFFCGAWTSCAITMIRLIAFVSVFTVDTLKVHVRELIHQKLPGFFVVQLKYTLLPSLLAIFVLLCRGILEEISLNSLVPEYPEWVKIYGTVLNILPIIVLFVCCIYELKVAIGHRSGSRRRVLYRMQNHSFNNSTFSTWDGGLSITDLNANSLEQNLSGSSNFGRLSLSTFGPFESRIQIPETRIVPDLEKGMGTRSIQTQMPLQPLAPLHYAEVEITLKPYISTKELVLMHPVPETENENTPEDLHFSPLASTSSHQFSGHKKLSPSNSCEQLFQVLDDLDVSLDKSMRETDSKYNSTNQDMNIENCEPPPAVEIGDGDFEVPRS